MFREEAEKRLIPSSGKEHFNNARMRLALDAEGRPDLSRALNEDEIVRAWIYGVVNQLISQPADIYIQKAIFEEMPELEEPRRIVLERQFLDFMAAQKEEVRIYSPKTIYDASLIMNSVYLSLLDQLAGTDFLSRTGVLPQSRKIARLLKATLEITSDSPESDRQITDLWADFLSIRDWYEWVSPNSEEIASGL
jgi:hypothetical protein